MADARERSADAAAPLIELCADPSAPPEEVRELSAVGHRLVSVRQVARLGSFSALRCLVLHGGSLRSLEGLSAVAGSLEELNVSGNALEVVTGLGALPQLRVLNLVRAACLRALARLSAALPHARRALTALRSAPGEQPPARAVRPGGAAAPGAPVRRAQRAAQPGRPVGRALARRVP